jgi:hypothetical protein
MLRLIIGQKPLIDEAAMTDNREKMLDKIRALLSETTENGCTEEEYLCGA